MSSAFYFGLTLGLGVALVAAAIGWIAGLRLRQFNRPAADGNGSSGKVIVRATQGLRYDHADPGDRAETPEERARKGGA